MFANKHVIDSHTFGRKKETDARIFGRKNGVNLLRVNIHGKGTKIEDQKEEDKKSELEK